VQKVAAPWVGVSLYLPELGTTSVFLVRNTQVRNQISDFIVRYRNSANALSKTLIRYLKSAMTF